MKIFKIFLLGFVLVLATGLITTDQETLATEVCAQVITPAVSPEGICKEFPTPCDVPEGWIKVDRCRERVCGTFGDINDDGYITQNDGLLVANYVSYPGNPAYILTDEQKKRADVTGNGKINIGDALAISNYAVGYLNTFKICSL